MSALLPGLGVAVGLVLVFGGALFWAKGRDPFERRWFWVRVPGGGRVQCVAVISKPVQPRPVVVHLHGASGTLLSNGNGLRQLAELGLAAVGVEYNQTNQAACEAELAAVLAHVQRQRWAQRDQMALSGCSLGANRVLSFALTHPQLAPKAVARIAGGWVEELKSEVRSPKSEVGGAAGLWVLLVHGEHDEVFPFLQAERVAKALAAKGATVELRQIPGKTHSLGEDREWVYRVVGESCLTRLAGTEAWGRYRSIGLWQADAWPLWVYWLPVGVWGCGWFWLRRGWGRQRPDVAGGAGRPVLRRWEVALRWAAGLLAAAALGVSAVHLVTPVLAVSDHTITIARRHLVRPNEQEDFSWLAADPRWRGQRLKTLLTHVELARYNRELVNWKVEDGLYRRCVLSPFLGDGTQQGPAGGLGGGPRRGGSGSLAQVDAVGLDWRRPLWESLYPRIRRETSMTTAAEIVGRYLRSRVTVVAGSGLPSRVPEIWLRQLTDACGFEKLLVAGLRSTGIPARLDSKGGAEYWTGTAWAAAPRPGLADMAVTQLAGGEYEP